MFVHKRLDFHLEEFRSGVRRGATESVQFPTDSELVTETKICYFNVHVCIQEEVLCLQTKRRRRRRHDASRCV